jgi:hypothetical protein
VHKIDSPCMTMTTYVHPRTGAAWLLRPAVADGERLSADYFAAEFAFLVGMGCEPLTFYDADEERDGWTLDGREVIGLYGFEPITSDPTMEELAEALADFRTLVPFVPDQRREVD